MKRKQFFWTIGHFVGLSLPIAFVYACSETVANPSVDLRDVKNQLERSIETSLASKTFYELELQPNTIYSQTKLGISYEAPTGIEIFMSKTTNSQIVNYLAKNGANQVSFSVTFAKSTEDETILDNLVRHLSAKTSTALAGDIFRSANAQGQTINSLNLNTTLGVNFDEQLLKNGVVANFSKLGDNLKVSYQLTIPFNLSTPRTFDVTFVESSLDRSRFATMEVRLKTFQETSFASLDFWVLQYNRQPLVATSQELGITLPNDLNANGMQVNLYKNLNSFTISYVLSFINSFSTQHQVNVTINKSSSDEVKANEVKAFLQRSLQTMHTQNQFISTVVVKEDFTSARVRLGNNHLALPHFIPVEVEKSNGLIVNYKIDMPLAKVAFSVTFNQFSQTDKESALLMKIVNKTTTTKASEVFWNAGLSEVDYNDIAINSLLGYDLSLLTQDMVDYKSLKVLKSASSSIVNYKITRTDDTTLVIDVAFHFSQKDESDLLQVKQIISQIASSSFDEFKPILINSYPHLSKREVELKLGIDLSQVSSNISFSVFKIPGQAVVNYRIILGRWEQNLGFDVQFTNLT